MESKVHFPLDSPHHSSFHPHKEQKSFTPNRREIKKLLCLIFLCSLDKCSSLVVPSRGYHIQDDNNICSNLVLQQIARSRNYHRNSQETRFKSFSQSSKLHAGNSPDDDIIDDEKVEEVDKNIFNKVGRVGSRVISSIRRENNNSDENGEENEATMDEEKETKKKNWFTRKRKEKKEKSNEDSTDNGPGVASFVSNTFKIKPKNRGESDDQVQGQDSSDSEPRSRSPFGQKPFSDPFKSEVALSKELEKQRALENYIAGSADEIPEELLPNTPIEGTLGIDQALQSLDDSLSFVREKLSEVRMNKNDDNNVIFLTPKQEEQRLNKMRRDLEIRRKNMILEDEKKKRDRQAIEAAKANKIREARAKSSQSQSEEDDVEEIIEIQKGRVGAFIDGAFVAGSNAVGNAWQAIRSTAKTQDEDEWIEVCPKTRISPGEVYPVVAGGLELLVIGSKDGTKVYCVSNRCPHLGTPLETGMVERRACSKVSGPSIKSTGLSTEDDTKQSVDDGFEDCIVCPLHKTAFSLDNGEVRGEWCPYPPVLGKVMGAVKSENNLTTFTLRSRGKNLEIKISSQLEEGEDES